jgi:hypothetical protein
MWGLPQAGVLANKLLRKRLTPPGYYKCVNTPGLWKHETRPITFSFVGDGFGIKYVYKEHAEHLINSLKEKHKLTKDWMDNLYCSISLNWNHTKQTLDILMP